MLRPCKSARFPETPFPLRIRIKWWEGLCYGPNVFPSDIEECSSKISLSDFPDFPSWTSITDLDESRWPEVPGSRQFDRSMEEAGP